MTSWLRTNSRKRKHGNRDDSTCNLHHTINFEEQSEWMLKREKEENNRKEQDVCVDPLHNNKRQKVETNKQDNNFIGQNDQATSPLRERTSDPSHLTTSICQAHKMSPGKENQLDLNKPEEKGTTKAQVLPQSDREQSNNYTAKQEENFEPTIKENKRKRSEIIKIEKDITEDCLLSSSTQQTAQQVFFFLLNETNNFVMHRLQIQVTVKIQIFFRKFPSYIIIIYILEDFFSRATISDTKEILSV